MKAIQAPRAPIQFLFTIPPNPWFGFNARPFEIQRPVIKHPVHAYIVDRLRAFGAAVKIAHECFVELILRVAAYPNNEVPSNGLSMEES